MSLGIYHYILFPIGCMLVGLGIGVGRISIEEGNPDTWFLANLWVIGGIILLAVVFKPMEKPQPC